MEKPPPINKEHYMLQTKDITEQNRKYYIKNYNPLDPRYVLSTKSGRRQIIGPIDNKPKVHSRRPQNVDTRRYLRTDDIEGAQPFYKRSSNNRQNSVYKSPTVDLLRSAQPELTPQAPKPTQRIEIEPYRVRSRRQNSIGRVNSYENVNHARHKITLDSPKQQEVQKSNIDPLSSKSVFYREIDDKQKRILNDFKKFTRVLGKPTEVKESREIKLLPISKREEPKSFVLNSHEALNVTERGHPRRNVGGVDGSFSYSNNTLSIDQGQRPSLYRKINENVNNTEPNISVPNTKRSRMLYAMKAEPNLKESFNLFSRSKRKVLEKSSGAYGNFASIDQIDKALKQIKERKNHSISY